MRDTTQVRDSRYVARMTSASDTPASGADLIELPKNGLAKEDKREKASIPTVPSAAQVAASLEENPKPTASSGA